ncbi:MAG TPA: hypothetical protein VHD90_17020 [Phototrophicaceae bacterium]|nr:hypothetical protein [Phototrophicaceae bacterium]
MTTLRLTGQITEDGQLEVNLPAGLPVGEVEVVIELPVPAWTDEEIHEFARPEPMTGAEIVAAGLTGGWKDEDILDGAAWVEAQRRKHKEQRGWS